MVRPARRRYVSLSEGQELLTPFECLPIAVTDVLFKYIGVKTRIRLMCVSRAMRAIVDRSAEIKPPHPCNNTLSIKFINTDITDENSHSKYLIGRYGVKVRLLFTVHASVTFAGLTASETFQVPLKNYDGEMPTQETPFLDRCIARILRRHADRVTELHLEGRPPIKLGKDVLASNDFLPVPVCSGMYRLTSLRTIRLKNINLCSPRYYTRIARPRYRHLKHAVHVFYSHYAPLADVLVNFIYRQFTKLRSLTIAPTEFAQPMYNVDDLISDNGWIPVIDIPIDIMSIERTSQLRTLKEIATCCEKLRLSINLDVFRCPESSTRDSVLNKVYRFFRKLNGVENVSQIYVYNIPLRNRYDVTEFHQILRDVQCDRMIVGSIRRTRADKTAWTYGCQHAGTHMSLDIDYIWSKRMKFKKKKKDEKRMRDRVEKWRKEERRRKLRSAMKVWVEADWKKFEKNWADKERKKARKERRKKAWRSVQRVKRSRALVKTLAKLLGADVEPFHRNY